MGKHHTVLVVDDDRDQLEVLAEVLASEGCAVRLANNGQQAIGAIEAGLQPCLILLDLQMPVVNSWEFATRLASLGETAASIALVVLSGEPHSGRLPFGAKDRLLKPVSFDTILRTVERHCALAIDQATGYKSRDDMGAKDRTQPSKPAVAGTAIDRGVRGQARRMIDGG